MEQQKTPYPSPPLPQPAIRRDQTSTRRANLSASTPLRPATTPPKINLWASEPSLRFPFPQGNQGLADWVSSSNPNIMHSEPNEDAGLAESSYEIISAANTDNEEQEDHYTESISESIGSLDFHRPDDVHSLAGTEHTYDEEESVPDDDDSYKVESPYEEDDDDDDDDDNHNNKKKKNDNNNRNDENDHDADNHGINVNKGTLSNLQLMEIAVASLSEDDHEARSQSSLEYTQQSLGTPSLPTPEASRLVERPLEPGDFKTTWRKKIERFWEVENQVKDYCSEYISAALPGLLTVLTFALMLQLFPNPKRSTVDIPEVSPVVATMTTTTTYTTTATATATATESIADPNAQPSATSAGVVDLIPVGDVVSDEWLFGANKPAISFTAQSNHGVLIHIPPKIKKTWQTKDCLTVTAKRGEALVDTTMFSADEGIIVRFAKKEVHGVVTLFLEATCRPKVHKVVKVHFGKGLMEEAIEMTRNLAQDLSKLVPATAQEAERRLGDAKRSLGSVCQNVCQNVQSASESVAKTFGSTFSETRQNLQDFASEAGSQISEHLSKVQDLHSALQFQILDAQISAKLWWLQTTGRREKREDYLRKAESFVAKKHAAVRKQGRQEKPLNEDSDESAPYSWWSRKKKNQDSYDS